MIKHFPIYLDVSVEIHAELGGAIFDSAKQ